jgi:hypothetical protein
MLMSCGPFKRGWLGIGDAPSLKVIRERVLHVLRVYRDLLVLRRSDLSSGRNGASGCETACGVTTLGALGFAPMQ